MSYEDYEEDRRPNRTREVYQSKIIRDKEDQDNSPADNILDEFDALEREIMNENGEIDHEKLRQIEKRGIQPLQKVDHTQIEYEDFQKDFYMEHPELQARGFEEVASKR